jgi:hypothetical protein
MGSSLSKVAPWTADQARQWRAAVLPRWLDPRWSALGWLTALVLLIGLEGDPNTCGGAGQRPCPSQWVDGAIGAIAVGQVGLVFAAPALGAVTRRVVIGLMYAPAPFAFYVEHVWLRRLFLACSIWTALTSLLAQRARRRQIAALPEGSEGPPLPPLRSVRPAQVFKTVRLAGALTVMALGLVLLGTGGVRQHLEDVHWRNASPLPGVVEAVSDDGTQVRVRLSTDPTTRWVPTDYPEDSPVGIGVTVWVDGTWARLYQDPFAQVLWLMGGYLCLLAGAATVAYALRWRRELHTLWKKQTRALRVRLGYSDGKLLIYPSDDPTAPPLLVVPRGQTFEVADDGDVRWHPKSGALYGDPSHGAVVAVYAEGQVILPSGRARARGRFKPSISLISAVRDVAFEAGAGGAAGDAPVPMDDVEEIAGRRGVVGRRLRTRRHRGLVE